MKKPQIFRDGINYLHTLQMSAKVNTHKKARSLVKETGPLEAETDSRQAGASHSAIVPQVSSLIKPQAVLHTSELGVWYMLAWEKSIPNALKIRLRCPLATWTLTPYGEVLQIRISVLGGITSTCKLLEKRIGSPG